MGITIAAYTVGWSGRRAAGDVPGYIGWLFVINAVPLQLVVAYRYRRRLGPALAACWRPAALGGALSVVAYGLVIWAMTLSPMAAVSALRETSVIVAALIGTPSAARAVRHPTGARGEPGCRRGRPPPGEPGRSDRGWSGRRCDDRHDHAAQEVPLRHYAHDPSTWPLAAAVCAGRDVGQRVHVHGHRGARLQPDRAGDDPPGARRRALDRPGSGSAVTRFPRTLRFWLFSVADHACRQLRAVLRLISFGQQRVDSGLAGILTGVMPLTTMVLARILLRPRRAAERDQGGGLRVGFGGLIVLIGPPRCGSWGGRAPTCFTSSRPCGASATRSTRSLARHRPPADPLVAAAGVMLAGGPSCCRSVCRPRPSSLPPPRLGRSPRCGAHMFATSIATVAFLKLVMIAGPSFTSFINYLIPVWAVLMGMAVSRRAAWRRRGDRAGADSRRHRPQRARPPPVIRPAGASALSGESLGHRLDGAPAAAPTGSQGSSISMPSSAASTSTRSRCSSMSWPMWVSTGVWRKLRPACVQGLKVEMEGGQGVRKALDDEQIGVAADLRQRLGPFGVTGIGDHLVPQVRRSAKDGAPEGCWTANGRTDTAPKRSVRPASSSTISSGKPQCERGRARKQHLQRPGSRSRRARRSGQTQRSRPPPYELCLEQQERQACEVVAVQMAEEDRVDRAGIDPEPPHGDHRGGAAVDQQAIRSPR